MMFFLTLTRMTYNIKGTRKSARAAEIEAKEKSGAKKNGETEKERERIRARG